jgi:hypothetical protein
MLVGEQEEGESNRSLFYFPYSFLCAADESLLLMLGEIPI